MAANSNVVAADSWSLPPLCSLSHSSLLMLLPLLSLLLHFSSLRRHLEGMGWRRLLPVRGYS